MQSTFRDDGIDYKYFVIPALIKHLSSPDFKSTVIPARSLAGISLPITVA